MKVLTIILLIVVSTFGLLAAHDISNSKKMIKAGQNMSIPATVTVELSPTIMPTPAATPTPKPLTVAEMNAKYGPCVKLPVLMFHHIQDEATAKPNNQQNLSVSPDFFGKDLQYLKDKGYNAVTMQQIADFFNKDISLPAKPVAITLDDGYEDNYTNAYPLLKQYNDEATIFTPTGLVDNPDYFTWDQMEEMAASGLIDFANHTWSHHASAGTFDVQMKEIGTADSQLSQKGFNASKAFAYPYGKPSADDEKILTSLGYNLAFTTTPGSILCKGQKYTLPRIRIGNAGLNRYGL